MSTLYGSRWRKARLRFLHKNPVCLYCAGRGDVTSATVVDHRIPHRGNLALFWDEQNWAACCAPCHNRDKQREEKTGRIFGNGPDGVPLDPRHPWNREPHR